MLQTRRQKPKKLENNNSTAINGINIPAIDEAISAASRQLTKPKKPPNKEGSCWC